MATGWVGATAGLLGVGAPRAHAASASAQVEPLEGSWRVDVDRTPLPPITALFTFMPGGALMQTGTDRLLGAGHGIWTKTADQEYDYTWVAPLFDQDSGYIGTRRARNHVRVDETLDAYATTGAVYQFDLAGNETLPPRQVIARATRIKFEPVA